MPEPGAVGFKSRAIAVLSRLRVEFVATGEMLAKRPFALVRSLMMPESDAVRRRVFFEEDRAYRAPKVTASAGPEPSLGRATASPWSHAAAVVQKMSALQDSPTLGLNFTSPCRDQMDFIRCPPRSVVGNVRLNEGPLRGHGFFDRVQWRVIDVSGVDGTGFLLFR